MLCVLIDQKEEEEISEDTQPEEAETKKDDTIEEKPKESTESKEMLPEDAEGEQPEAASSTKNSDDVTSLSSPTKSSSASPWKSPEIGGRRRRTKQALKEQLREQKVIEKKMALRSRRQRKMNQKYLSDDFTSIFTENKQLLESGESYVEVVEAVETVGVEEEVMETSVEVSNPQTDVDYTHGIELEGEQVGDAQDDSELAAIQDGDARDSCDYSEVMLESEQPTEATEDQNISLSDLVPLTHMTRSKSRAMSDAQSDAGRATSSERGSRPTTPYSEISADSFHSDLGKSTGRHTPEVGAGEGRVTRRRGLQTVSPLDSADQHRFVCVVLCITSRSFLNSLRARN